MKTIVKLRRVLTRSIPSYNRRTLYAQALTAIFTLVLLSHNGFQTGEAIGLLAVVAVLMTISETSAEKVVWTGLCFLLFFAETRAIQEDRAKQADQQMLNDLLTEGKFARIDRSVGQSLRKLQVVSSDVKNGTAASVASLRNITGGDAFALVYPAVNPYDRELRWKAHNAGDYPLTAVTATIYQIMNKASGPLDDLQMTFIRTIPIGVLAPRIGRDLHIGDIAPESGAPDYVWIKIYVNAQNQGVNETIVLRQSGLGRGLAFRMLAYRMQLATERNAGSEVFAGKRIRCLLDTDWIEPTPVNQPDNFNLSEDHGLPRKACSVSRFYTDLR